MRRRLGSTVMVAVLLVACGPPAARTVGRPRVRPAPPEPSTTDKGLQAYGWRVASLRALAALDRIRHNARQHWKQGVSNGIPRWLRNKSGGADRPRRFPPPGSGWFPSAPCCSFRERRCPALFGEPPVPWKALVPSVN